MLAADAELDIGPGRPSALGCNTDKLADAILVEGDEGILLIDALFLIDLEEPAGIVA